MKTFGFIFPIMVLLCCSMAFSQKVKYSELTVQSSVQCEMCKKRVLQNMYTHKKEGIKTVQVNLTTKQILVRYDSALTNPGQIRTWISMIGYKADDIPADPETYSKLPNCCK